MLFIEHYVRCGLMKYYCRYLKKLSEVHLSLRSCRAYTEEDFSELVPNNNDQIINHYIQLKELTIFLSKVR